ncbi:MAG TPA: sugar phosphate isomerase/epimerase family protein [Deltaproteobacteria bacterium]|nr:sugar phosphate isomerase/epimerase family protein [Deltaproteobacteria bacterium]HQI81410.1 sugar phosphate isomerase/epimerase family protein [Deltaproteobacteria bacterium]
MITIGGRAHSMEEVREVARLGYPFAELSLNDPAVVAAQLPELLDMQRATGISLLAHYPNEDNPFDAAVLRERFLPRIRSLIDLTQRLGIPKATIHFWMDRRWAPEGLIGEKIEILEEIVAHAAAAGIDICIENLSERYESFRMAFDAISGLKMTLDIGHAQLLARVNTSHGFIEHCMDRIAHVHVHDNHGGTSVKDDLHLPLGQGIVDYPAILASLIEAGYDSTITMEVKPAQMPLTRDALQRCIGTTARLP